jgi:protein gp37
MGANSKIAWTDHTWNPWSGCPDDGQRSPACDHCYARAWAKHFRAVDFDREIKRVSDKTFFAPLNRKKYKSGDKVFVCSLSDFFHPAVPDEFVAEAWKIIQHDRPDLTWLFLTKRPQNIDIGKNWPSYESLTPNLWLGVTCENQEQADHRIPELLKIPAAVRFISIEPMLSEMKISKYLGETVAVCSDCGIVDAFIERGPEGNDEVCENCGLSVDFIDGLDWVIVGGESGPGARPMNPDWVRSVRDQCQAAKVPFFLKQWGDNPAAEAFKEPHGLICARIVLPHYGHMLDGREWLEFPEGKK